MIRPLYNWVLKQAEKTYASTMLFGVSFAEASFFPLPPDIMLLPMCMARRDRAYFFAFITTIGSVLGALLGYAIGALAMDTVGVWVQKTYHLEKAFQNFHDGFEKWGVWILFLKGLTPIPFKVMTIASGAAKFDLFLFVLTSAVTRGLRFFLIAFLMRRHGKTIHQFIDDYLPWVAGGVLALIAIGFLMVIV